MQVQKEQVKRLNVAVTIKNNAIFTSKNKLINPKDIRNGYYCN